MSETTNNDVLTNYSFSRFGLVPKKEYVYSNHLMSLCKPLVAPVYGLCAFHILQNYKASDLALYAIPSLFVADLISALSHMYVDFRQIPYVVDKDKYLKVNCELGYHSFHHAFTMDTEDITDSTLIATSLVRTFVPLALSLKFGNAIIKKLASYTTVFLSLAACSHKYCHLKRHGKSVPKIVDLLSKMRFFLRPNYHQIHHMEHNRHFSDLNASSDWLTDSILDKFANDIQENIMSNVYRYTREYKTNKIRIRFANDVEGTIILYLYKGRLFTKEDYRAIRRA